MANKDMKMNIDIGINKSGLNELKKMLSEIRVEAGRQEIAGKLTDGLKKAAEAASKLDTILNQSWNTKLNQLDLSKVNGEIQKTFGNVQNLQKAFTGYAGGAKFYTSFAQSVANTNIQLKQQSALMDRLATTFKNTLRYGLSSSVINTFSNSIQRAYSYTKELDSSLNDIRIVTGKSADEMDRFAVRANKVAKDLGRSTKDFTDAALIYYQQGLGNEEAQARAEVTMKAANVTGQSGREVSEQLTAVWNGYKVTADEAELYVDKLAAVAATTASDLEELSTGMSKVASAANLMGVDIDQLNAQLATIVSVTRQAPESVGTALKTIYARMSNIQAGLDDETTLGNYTEKMAQMGVNVLNANGQLRDMGDVIEEIGAKWATMSREQQIALSQTMAGTRQYNNLLSLFDNWDMYTSALQTSANAAGTLQKQQDIYMETTEAHLQKLATEAEKTYSILFDQDVIKGFTDGLQGALSVLNSYFKGLGGGLGTIVSLGAQATNLFSNQISESISRHMENQNIQARTEDAIAFKQDIAKTVGYNPETYGTNEAQTASVQKQYELFEGILKVKSALSDKEFQETSEKIKQIGLLEEQVVNYNKINKKVNDINEEYSQSVDKVEKYQHALEEIENQGLAEIDIDSLNEVDQVLESIGLKTKERTVLLNDETRLTETLQDAIVQELEKQEALTDEGSQYKEIDEQIIEEKQRQGYELENQVLTTQRLAEQQQDISAAVKGISATSYLITSSFGMLKTIFDDSMTPLEKMGAIASVLASQAVTIVANYENFGKILPGIAKMLGINNVLEAQGLSIEKLTTLELIKQIALKLKENIQHGITNILLAIKNALEGNFIALAIAAGIAVAAVGTALAIWITNLVEANSEENRLNEKIKETKAKIEEATTAYNELKDTISNYQDARKGIDNLTEGTTEFYDAILKSNAAAQELIDKFNLIVGQDYTIDKNGLITLNQNSLTERQFKEQQELFRRNASLNQLQLRAEEINQEKVIREFAKESGFSNEISTAIFKNINSNLETTESALSNASRTGKDITKALSSTWTKYEQSQNQQEILRQEESANLIRGYGSKELVDRYNALTVAQQQSVNKYVADQQKANQRNLQIYNGNGDFWSQVGYGIGLAIMGPVGPFVHSQNEFNKALVKQEYAKNALGYQESNGVWTDRYGKTVKYDDIIKDIDTDTAMNAYNSGEYTTSDSAQAMLNVIKEAKEKAYREGMNEASQNYVAEAYAAIKSGNLNYDIAKLLTDEEKNVVSQLIEGQALGIDSDKVQQWLQTNSDISRTVERLAADAQAYKATLSEQAKALETSTEALDLYAYAMRRAGTITDEVTEATAKAAAQSYSFNKAYNKAADSFADNEKAYEKYIDALKNGQEVSYDVVDAVAELQKELETMTGLSFSPELLEKEYGNIKTMLTGTADEAEAAYNRIQAAAIENTLIDSLGYNVEQAANFVSYLGTLDPGEELNQTWSQNLAQMVNNAHMTREQVEQLFATMHIALPEMEEIEAKENTFTTAATSTRHRYKGQIPTGKVNFFTGEAEYADVDYEWTETTEPVQQKYVTFNDQKVNFKRDSSTKGSFGRAGSGNFTKKLNSGKSSGGGSGGSKSQRVDPLEEEADRYHDINAQLSSISNELDKAEKKKEKLFGKDLIEETNREIGLLNERIEVTKEKINELTEERKELQDKLGKQGVAFDADGFMTNYEEAFTYQLGIVNSVIDNYNDMTAEEQEKAKDDLEKAQEAWKEFKDDMSRYDAIQNSDLYKAEEEKQKDLDEIISNQIENFNYKIEIGLDMAEAERDWNKFQREIIKGIKKDTNIVNYADWRLEDFKSYYKSDGTGAIQQITQQVNDILIDLHRMDEGLEGVYYGNDRKSALADLKKYSDMLTSNLKDVQELQEEIHEQYISMQDEAQEKFDEQVHNYELIGDLIDHDIKLIQMVYGEDSYSALGKYYQRQEENNNKQLDFQRQQVEFWKAQMDAAKGMPEAWENAKEKWENAVTSLNNTIEKSIENLQNKYLNAVNQIFKDLNDKVTGGLGLDYINEEWTLINKNAEQYLDTINNLFGIQQLENKYLDAIDRTDSVGAQRQLKEIMDAELKGLRERDKLTQYDVDRANKKYEIALKQIALQEAQQNKTKMRLRRDSQGNYRYEYTSDNDQINQIQDELNGLYNSLYNFDKARYQENLNQIYSVWSEFQQKMAEAAQINDPQERAERELLLKEEYGKLINGLVEQNEDVRYNLQESAFQDLAILYNKNVNDYKTMTDTEKDLLMNDLIPQWDKGVQHMADVFAGEGGFIPVCKEAFDELDGVTKEYQKSIHTLEEKAGIDLKNVAKGTNDIYEETDQLLKKNDELIGKYGEEMTRIGEVMGELQKLTAEYDKARIAAEKATEAAYKYRMEQNRINTDTKDETTIPAAVTKQTVQKTIAKTIEDAVVKNSKTNSISSANSMSSISSTSSTISSTHSHANSSHSHKNLSLSNSSQEMVPLPLLNSSGDNMLVESWNARASQGEEMSRAAIEEELQKLKKKVPGLGWSSFASGGYTGVWGNSGRLALLHQKELVLNAHDTENMLNAVTIMRDITSTLGGSVLNRLAGIAAAGSNGTANNGMLDQNVNIQATFPNVTNSHEIEDALNNLVNMAAIRANRKGS